MRTVKDAIGYLLGYGSCECGKTLQTAHSFGSRIYCCDCLPHIGPL